MESAVVVEALRRVAQTLSGSLELDSVFDRVAEVARSVIPCEDVIIARLGRDGNVQVHAYVFHGGRVLYTGSLTDCSPSMQRALGGTVKSDDPDGLLDASYGADRWALGQGYRSGMVVPLARGTELLGNFGVTSRRRVQFTEDHEGALAAIADLVVLALEHERLWDLDAAQRRRMDAIDTLLLTMADSIHVREIFDRVSAVVRPVLSHDRMALITPCADGQRIRIEAVSGGPIPDLPHTLPVHEQVLNPELEYELYSDVDVVAPADSETLRLARKLNIRSVLRIPLRMETGELGALIFISQTPGMYQPEDVLIARRVADHVSLALSHQRLAEEARRLVEERQRAEALEERVQALRTELEAVAGAPRVLGESRSWKEVLNQAAKVAPTETTVLLTGESGTGKDVVARFIHRGSPRSGGPFVAVNCAALPEALLESELFGHEKGAFTGATAARAGRIHQAAGGVLFLDEVGEMSLPVQAKLLRVLQEKEYQPLGGSRTLKADVRILAATNRDLEEAIRRGTFREDLYYRLRVFEIHLPPLRERRDDILPMAEAFLEEIGRSVGRPAAGISRDALGTLLAYRFPGNVRELRNAIERATILCDGGLITVDHLPMGVQVNGTTGKASVPAASPSSSSGSSSTSPAAFPSAPASASPFASSSASSSASPSAPPSASASAPAPTSTPVPAAGMNLVAVEREMILRALTDAGNNRSKAARILGITRSQLYTRMQRHGLVKDAPTEED